VLQTYNYACRRLGRNKQQQQQQNIMDYYLNSLLPKTQISNSSNTLDADKIYFTEVTRFQKEKSTSLHTTLATEMRPAGQFLQAREKPERFLTLRGSTQMSAESRSERSDSGMQKQ
jgi:hypothetical protein